MNEKIAHIGAVDYSISVSAALDRVAQAVIYGWRYAPGAKPALGDFATAVGVELARNGAEVVEQRHRRQKRSAERAWNTPGGEPELFEDENPF